MGALMSYRYDPRTGGMVRTKPSPVPADLARAMVRNLYWARRDREGAPMSFDRLPPAEQRVWLDAAHRTIRDMGL